ncbi:MAG: hypothetical protein JJU15_00915 [Pararhodobacter sp.]|nr:hypothetical protein [Pararhodobacter sp.]
MRLHVQRYPANWRAFGNRAEAIRNDFMLTDSRPDLVLAFAGGNDTRALVLGALEAVTGNREGLIAESVDLLYHLAVLWHDRGAASVARCRSGRFQRARILASAKACPACHGSDGFCGWDLARVFPHRAMASPLQHNQSAQLPGIPPDGS